MSAVSPGSSVHLHDCRVKSLLQQAQNTIHLPPERIVWCYSQWQLAYSELSMTVPEIEFVKGIPSTLEQDSYFDVNIRNLIIILRK